MGGIGVRSEGSIDLAKQGEMDEKTQLLDEIKEYLEFLQDDRIKQPSESESIEVLRNLKRYLKTRINKDRYAFYFEEALLFSARKLGSHWNGDQEFFGYKPDLRELDIALYPKLRKMRFDTSEIIKNLIKTYDVSPMISLVLELGLTITHVLGKPKQESKESEESDVRRALITIDKNTTSTSSS
jgi:hypothetical protein